MEVVRANLNELEQVAGLFNAYRVFYGQDSDKSLASQFIKQRLEQDQSVIFVAKDVSGVAVGFTQLYPTFSSVSATRSWILNDLFVAENQRGGGIGKALLEAAKQHAVESGANGIALETSHDNFGAQKLYESLGYEREINYRSYFLTL